MLKRVGMVLSVLAVLLLSAFVFNKVAAVTLDDVTHHFSLGRSHATIGVSGGDIYAISPDGLSEMRLCSLTLQEDFVVRVAVTAMFTNTIGDTLPFLVRFVSLGADKPAGVDADFAGARLRFDGQFTELQSEAPRGAPPECERKMAEFMNQRYRICMVRASLIPTENAVFSAYRFDPFQMFVPQSLYALHGMEKSDAAIEVQTQKCPETSGVAWDVAIRKSLRVINMEGIDQVAEASGG